MKKTVLYEEALVTYLDILGFRELVQTESAGRISRTIRLVRDALKPSHDRAKLYEMTYQSFSDLTVVSIPVLTSANLYFRPGALRQQIVRVANAQVDLLQEGIVVRGAITFGSIVRSYGQLFGPALIKAYDLESKVAIYPRVIIDDIVFRELKRNPALTMSGGEDEEREIMRLVIEDRDHHRFIDYLSVFYRRSDSRPFRRFLKDHKQLIDKGLEEFSENESVVEKYRWMAAYHNRKIKELRVRKATFISV
jgi:hypothetical protein